MKKPGTHILPSLVFCLVCLSTFPLRERDQKWSWRRDGKKQSVTSDAEREDVVVDEG